MAEEALDAWLYHETLYDSGIPPAYGVFSLGDHYIYLTAKFLTSYLMERPKDREAFIENFLNKQFNFEGYEYLKPHYKEYLRYVLKLVHKHPKYSIILSKPKYLISSNRYYLGRLSLLRR